jgi:transposase
MLKPPAYPPPTELDRRIFEATGPQDHYLRRVLQAVDFERCRPLVAGAYDPQRGRPAYEPVLLLKLEFLQYHYNLSDRQVVEQAQYNMAFRLFLGLSLDSALPDPSLLSHFRGRLGAERHQQLFDAVVGQAREKGLVKDRLRLKDATHVLANIALPSTIALVAQTRERLLQALQPWAAERVAEARRQAEAIRTATADLSGEERLLQRVAHLRALLTWAAEVPAQAAPAARPALEEALRLTHKVLADRDAPQATDQLVSLHDPQARRAKHGTWYTGYLVDVAVDADSEIITAVDVLPANANEGADASTLIAREEHAHGNDVQAVSLDGAGYQGAVLRTLADPAGLHLEVFVPPPAPPPTGFFTSEQFALDAAGTTLTCPAGQATQRRRRGAADSAWRFHFTRGQCAGCPLLARCMPGLPQTMGRSVSKNDYEAEYRAAQARARTPAYAAVRREHAKVERKLADLVRWHGGRRARYRGQGRVLLQQLLTALVVNVKRLVSCSGGLRGGGGAVRAGWAGSG